MYVFAFCWRQNSNWLKSYAGLKFAESFISPPCIVWEIETNIIKKQCVVKRQIMGKAKKGATFLMAKNASKVCNTKVTYSMDLFQLGTARTEFVFLVNG